MGATLSESIVFHHKDDVGAPDRRQVVRDGDGSFAFHQTVQGFALSRCGIHRIAARGCAAN